MRETVRQGFWAENQTVLGRAGSPLPAVRPHNDGGAHGVTRPTQNRVPLEIGAYLLNRKLVTS